MDSMCCRNYALAERESPSAAAIARAALTVGEWKSRK